VPPVDELRQSVGGRKNLKVGIGAIRKAAFAHRLRQPPHEQQPKHETARYDVEQFRLDQQIRIAERFGERGVEQSILTAEQQSEIDVLDEIADGIDRHHQQKEARRAENARVTDIADYDSGQHRQPDDDHSPVNERRDELHAHGVLLETAPSVQRIGGGLRLAPPARVVHRR
jgi:hypothetical protein